MLIIAVALGTALAVARATREGWWWVLTGVPPLILMATAGVDVLAGASASTGSAGLATVAIRSTAAAFPAMVTALIVGLAVVAVRLVRERGRAVRREGRRD
ncbi:hypothetical protein [Kitasatospora mediocidica]|uniref:hypothetical protein n=1 Tax=Kitasatospora mediocidica TaxID=58352 RepID=UPI000562319C|nr:hypothetical protein [Kitasatospora mediocidica]